MRETEITHFQCRQRRVYQPLLYTKETNIFLLIAFTPSELNRWNVLALQGKALLSEETHRGEK